LNTKNSSTFVAAINEIHDSIGEVLMTTTATTIKSAINELDSDRDRLTTYTGMPVAITGMDNSTGNVISTALLNLDSALGNRTALTTTADQDLVVAINELDAEIGTVTTGAMGTSASTIVTAIKEITDELGNVTAGAMGTSASTIVTAIAEHETQINANLATVVANKATIDSDTGVINAANMGTVAHTIVNAINELHTQIDNLDSDGAANPVGAISSLTTTVKSSIVNAINSLDSDVGTRTSLNTTADQNLVVAINEVSNRAINVKDSDGTLLNTL
jgi:hypothetical protein